MWYGRLQADAALLIYGGSQWWHDSATLRLFFTEYRDKRWLVWC
jgi:hypothetical protein